MYRCVHVIKNAQPENAAICRIVAVLSENLEPFGYRTSVICLGEDGPLVRELELSGANVRTVLWTGARRDFATSRGFYSAIRAERPDIVHVHHGGLAVRILSRIAGGHVVVQHVHSRILENRGTTIKGASFRGADAVIATSRAVASCLSADAIEVIYPGVKSPSRPTPLCPKEMPLLGVAARLVALKGIHVLIDAVAKLHQNGLSIRLQIAGVGPCEDSLRRQIRDLGMSNRIELFGWSADLSRLRENWDVAVVPSLEEGFGLAALEAMAMGRAVIASRIGGLPELVANSDTGLLVAPGDVNALAAAIAQLAIDRHVLASMGVAAWERARSHFSTAHMAASTAALYERLLNRSK